MFSIDTSDAVLTQSARPDPGDEGFFTEGNPASGQPATVVTGWWLNMVQNELREAVVSSGLTPDKGDDTQLSQAIMLLAQAARTKLAYAATPWPTIGTATYTIGATASSASQGGRVSVSSGILLTLGRDLGGGLCVQETHATTAWQSVDLATSATRYLRARVTGGVLELYVQGGSDSDTTPASLVGTPNATSGGGFDSTVLDILLAKVVTGGAGSTPTITNLANAALLYFSGHYNDDNTNGVTAWTALRTATINWGRTPAQVSAVLRGYSSAGQDLASTVNSNSAGLVERIAVRLDVSTRYAVSTTYIYEDSNDNNGRIAYSIHARG